MNPVRINTSRIIAVAFVLVVSAWPGFADEGFKASSIKGDYGFTCTGTVYGNPFAGIGQVSCDGRSTCSGVGTINLNGVSLPWTVIGSYTLGADGRGQVTYDQTVAGGPRPAAPHRLRCHGWRQGNPGHAHGERLHRDLRVSAPVGR